jgi:UDP-N-acetylmuramate: L-alanyl-gamma-D-glutamyl-meso-diaminopimelate ligase
MHLHILGIGGTFMAGVALLARELGHDVTGSDAKVYPPMSTQLERFGIELREGYLPSHLQPRPDLVIIGNALSRGNAAVEAVLDEGIPYTSGAQWLAENVLRDRWVLAVAGTHGKTGTASLLAWILECAGLAPGFLVGGIPENFGVSARLGATPFFVIEADEYDTAFFDKRSKFVHYRPRTAILNNLEYDHADIFPDVEAIKTQFHHLIRTVPASGRLIVNGQDEQLAATLRLGCWTPVEYFVARDVEGGIGVGRRAATAARATATLMSGAGHAKAGGRGAARRPESTPSVAGAMWEARARTPDASHFETLLDGVSLGEARWQLAGLHNLNNALAAIAAARHAGVPVATALQAVGTFQNVKRRLEIRGVINGVTVYDDFAHHPTAIGATLAALRSRVGNARIVAVLEPRSNTMRMGVHRDTLGASLSLADRVLVFRPADITWNIERVTRVLDGRGRVFDTVAAILDALAQELRPGDHVLIMSNGGFDNIHARLLERLQDAATTSREQQA